MTFAKGRSECEAERDIIIQGFRDLVQVLNESKRQSEISYKAELYNLLTDYELSKEELQTQREPFEKLLSEQEEKDCRIRNTILIGIFSFWEVSMKNLCEYYKLGAFAGCQSFGEEPENGSAKLIKSQEYVKWIFGDDIPEEIRLVNTSIRNIRNYVTHGSIDKRREDIIKSLKNAHPEFDIVAQNAGFHFTSYDGIEKILDAVIIALEVAEEVAEQRSNK